MFLVPRVTDPKAGSTVAEPEEGNVPCYTIIYFWKYIPMLSEFKTQEVNLSTNLDFWIMVFLKKLRNTVTESLKRWHPTVIQCWQKPKSVQFFWKAIWHN